MNIGVCWGPTCYTTCYKALQCYGSEVLGPGQEFGILNFDWVMFVRVKKWSN